MIFQTLITYPLSPRCATKEKRIFWVSQGFRQEHPRAATVLDGCPLTWEQIDSKTKFLDFQLQTMMIVHVKGLTSRKNIS